MPPITTRHSLITNNCLSTNVPHELGHPHPTGNVGIVTMSHRWPGNVGWRHIWRSVWKAAPGSWRTVWVRWRPESPPAPLETSPAVPWKRDNINTHKMMFKTHSFVVVVFFWGFFAFSNKWASPLFDCRFLARTSVSLWWPEREDATVHTVGSFPPPFFFLNTSIWVEIIIAVMSFFTFLTLSLMWNTFMTNWEGEWKMNVTQRWLIGGVVHRYLLVLLMLGLSLGIVQCNTPTVRRGIRRLKLTSH